MESTKLNTLFAYLMLVVLSLSFGFNIGLTTQERWDRENNIELVEKTYEIVGRFKIWLHFESITINGASGFSYAGFVDTNGSFNNYTDLIRAQDTNVFVDSLSDDIIYSTEIRISKRVLNYTGLEIDFSPELYDFADRTDIRFFGSHVFLVFIWFDQCVILENC